jgi:cyclophilin family peptidyl-prolyl cis-trans isomerase
VPTDKRARQKAARRQKRAAELRRARTRRLLRNGGFIAVGGAVVLVLVLLTSGVFSSNPPPKKSTSASTTTTSSTTTTTTLPPAEVKTLQATADKAAVAAGCPATPKTRTNTLHWSSAPAMTIDVSKTYTATVETTAGSFVIALDAKAAPHTVNNFVFLADQGFYKCNVFHRVIPGFMDQTGDPTDTGAGGPGYEFADENVPTAYATGDVAMANSGPGTNGSQFFVLAPGGARTLDADLKRGDKYPLFGTVTSGMPVVEKINREGNASPTATGVPPDVVQRILNVTIHES